MGLSGCQELLAKLNRLLSGLQQRLRGIILYYTIIRIITRNQGARI